MNSFQDEDGMLVVDAVCRLVLFLPEVEEGQLHFFATEQRPQPR